MNGRRTGGLRRGASPLRRRQPSQWFLKTRTFYSQTKFVSAGFKQGGLPPEKAVGKQTYASRTFSVDRGFLNKIILSTAKPLRSEARNDRRSRAGPPAAGERSSGTEFAAGPSVSRPLCSSAAAAFGSRNSKAFLDLLNCSILVSESERVERINPSTLKV